MTRINLVPPQELCNQHLLAEYREMPRIVSVFMKALGRRAPIQDQIPKEYVLGTGHIKFFYDKFKFLWLRHQLIRKELIDRGFNLTHTNSNVFLNVPKAFFNNYIPPQHSIELSKQRIKDRMPKNPRFNKK